jgi:hypothetical protein
MNPSPSEDGIDTGTNAGCRMPVPFVCSPSTQFESFFFTMHRASFIRRRLTASSLPRWMPHPSSEFLAHDTH